MGALVGVGVGAAAVRLVPRVRIDQPGLHPILILSFGALAFGLAAVLGGSGFLAAYLAGIVVGNRTTVFRRGVLAFHDAAAWLAQIVLFVMLGLLSFPSRVFATAGAGLALAAVLIFVARPVAVALSAGPFGFRLREMALLSWGGLKGAVPVTLATFPLLAGISGGEALFDVVFFVVLVSAVVQGSSLPAVARRLGLGTDAAPPPPLSVEVNALRHLDGEIVDYTVWPSARIAGQRLRDLTLPDGAAFSLVVRGDEVIVPRGATPLRPGDHAFVAMRSALKPLVDRLFDPDAATPPLPVGLTLHVAASATLGQLHRFFGFPGPTWASAPVASLLEAKADVAATADEASVRLGPFAVTPGPEADLVTLTVVEVEVETAPIGLSAHAG